MRLKKTLIALAASGILASTLSGCGTMHAMGNLEKGAWGEFNNMWDRWVESEGDIAYATTWDRQVQPGVKVEDIEYALEEVALAMGLKDVGTLPLSKELESRGVKTGYIQVKSYCNPATARKMMNFTMHAAAFLPCRITIAENEKGEMWMYTLNMDMMIKMGKKQPKELLPQTYKVRNTIKAMMMQGASGGYALDMEKVAEMKDQKALELYMEDAWAKYKAEQAKAAAAKK